MKSTGKLVNVQKDFFTNKLNMTFQVDFCSEAEIENLKNIETLEVTAEKQKKHRSKDANALLWACLGEIGKAMKPPVDKWEVYLLMLKRYGEYTYICVKPSAVDGVKRQWRECEEVGTININGQEAVQMLCYYGSSTYTTAEMAKLLEGVISEMAEMGIKRPAPKELEEALKEYEKISRKHHNE